MTVRAFHVFAWLVLVNILSITSVTAGREPITILMEDYCSNDNHNYQLDVHEDVLLKMTPNARNQKDNYDCSVSFKLRPTQGTDPSGVSMRARFLAFSADKDSKCATGAIQIFDSSRTILQPYCNDDVPGGNIYDLGEVATVNVYNRNWIKGDKLVFDLLITAVSKKDSPSKQCPAGYFDCGETKCVPDNVTCNGYNDCIGGKDEESCTSSDNSVVDGLLGVVILVIIYACIKGLCISCD